MTGVDRIPRRIARKGEIAVEKFLAGTKLEVPQFFIKHLVDTVKEEDRIRKELDERSIGDLIKEREEEDGSDWEGGSDYNSYEATSEDSPGDDEGHSMSEEIDEEENVTQVIMKAWGISSQEE